MKEFYNNFHVHVDVWRTNYCYAHAAKSKKMFPTCSLQWIRSNHLSFSFFLREKIIYALINANNQFIPTKNRLEIEKSIQKKNPKRIKNAMQNPTPIVLAAHEWLMNMAMDFSACRLLIISINIFSQSNKRWKTKQNKNDNKFIAEPKMKPVC